MKSVFFSTSGQGLWSSRAKSVRIVDMQLGYISDSVGSDGVTPRSGELRVYFDTDTWDCDSDGLIYTDPGFVRDLEQFCEQQNLAGYIDYSEQGMQGWDYVSFDVGDEFLDTWAAKFGIEWAAVA
jgi:hypothetical protein